MPPTPPITSRCRTAQPDPEARGHRLPHPLPTPPRRPEPLDAIGTGQPRTRHPPRPAASPSWSPPPSPNSKPPPATRITATGTMIPMDELITMAAQLLPLPADLRQRHRPTDPGLLPRPTLRQRRPMARTIRPRPRLHPTPLRQIRRRLPSPPQPRLRRQRPNQRRPHEPGLLPRPSPSRTPAPGTPTCATATPTGHHPRQYPRKTANHQRLPPPRTLPTRIPSRRQRRRSKPSGLVQAQPRIRPDVGTPVPAVTSTCSTSGTGFTEVPRN